MYTDGSKIDGQTGSGLAVYKGKKEHSSEYYRLPDDSTVFQAEVTAVAKAAELLIGMRDHTMEYVKIFIDSQAAITALGNPRITSHTVANAVESLNRLADSTTKVTLVWIPAHKGHTGNERADTLAKQGAQTPDPRKLINVRKPHATVKAEIRRQVANDWQNEWTRSNQANHAKTFYAGPNPSKAKFVYKLARLELGRFVRIVTGHNNLNFFQTKIGLANNPSCRFCMEGDETITHLLSNCPRFFSTGRELFLDQLPTADMKWSVRDLLDFSYTPEINGAFEGTWADGDPLPQTRRLSDTSLDLMGDDEWEDESE